MGMVGRGLGGVALTAALPRPWMPRLQAAAARVEGRSPDEAASDEAYWLEVQQTFTVARDTAYLNTAGGSPSPRAVTEAVVRRTWEQEKLPSHALYTALKAGLETVRVGLAGLFGCDPEEVAVVRNATEALQAVLLGVGLKRGDEVLTTTQDYWAMLDALEQRQRREGIVVKRIRVPTAPRGPQDLASAFEQALSGRTRLILVSHPVNLTGQHFPIRRICEVAHRRGIEVVVDGAQSFGQFPLRHADLGCDYLGASLQKWLMAPKSTGMLFVRREKIRRLWPLFPPPRGMDADIRKFEQVGGRSYLPLAIAEAIAFQDAVGLERKAARLRYLTRHWVERLRNLPNVRFHTTFGEGFSGALGTAEVVGVDSGALYDHLLQRHRILTFDVARRTNEFQGIRVSPGLHTTLDELDRFCGVIEAVARNGLPS